MLYLISGASRSGKSLLARRLLETRTLPYLSLDWLMMGFNDGIPDYGIHHLLWPDEIARRMWPFTEAVLHSILRDDVDYVIEGEALLPGLVAELIADDPKRIRAVFLGYCDIPIDDKIDQVVQHSDSETDWLASQSRDKIREHIGNMVVYSRRIKAQCADTGLRYIDTSREFIGRLNEAESELLER